MKKSEKPTPAKPVTLGEVARLSGVSRATASRALNGRDGVKPSVRKRIRLVAKSLDYRPNRAAKNLSSGRSSIIGLLMPSKQLSVDPYASSLLQAVAKKAEERDEGLMLMLGHNKPALSVRNALTDGLIDGVILSSVAVGSDWVEDLLDTRIPKVLIGSHPTRDDIHCVNVENLESTITIVNHLLEQGVARLANITGELSRVDARDRAEGFRIAHRRRTLPVDESLILEGNFAQSAGFRLTNKLLPLKPEGIVAGNDETAIGAIRAIERAGLRVPDDIVIVGFDGFDNGLGFEHGLTTMCQPLHELAGLAVSTLLSILSGDSPPLNQVIEPTLRIGSTSKV